MDMLVGIAVLGMVIAGFAVTQDHFRRANALHWLRVRCVDAAQAQLDSLAATGRAIPAEQSERLWPGIKLEVDTQPGKGAWRGLSLARASAGGRAGRAEVKVELARYVDLEAKP